MLAGRAANTGLPAPIPMGSLRVMYMLFEDMVHIMYCSEADVVAGWRGYDPNRRVDIYSSSDEDCDGNKKKYYAGELEARDSARKRLRGAHIPL